MITIRANDAAGAALGLPFDVGGPSLWQDPGELGEWFRESELVRDERGALYIPELSCRQPHVPEFATLTERECWMNSWHLDYHPDVVNVSDDSTPHIEHEGQLHMLRQGITLSRTVLALARALPGKPPVCCITTVNSTCGVFKFHQPRRGECYLTPGKIDNPANPHPLVGITMVVAIEESPG